VVNLHHLTFVICCLFRTLGSDEKIKTDWKSHQQCWNYSFARQSDPRFQCLWLIYSILVSIFVLYFLATFVSYSTICGEMTGFSVFIGVWEMMPKPKNCDWGVSFAYNKIDYMESILLCWRVSFLLIIRLKNLYTEGFQDNGVYIVSLSLKSSLWLS